MEHLQPLCPGSAGDDYNPSLYGLGLKTDSFIVSNKINILRIILVNNKCNE